MRPVSATEAKQALSRLLDAAQREPVVIQKQRRDVAVLLSMRDYERLTAMNVADFQDYCDRMSQRARERGLTEETLDTLLRDQR
jgi:prevent-host-death family protein